MPRDQIITTRSPEFMAYERKNPYYGWNETPKGPKQHIGKVLLFREWKDQPCFVVGGGPSLRGFDFERLNGKGRIIAVNKSFLAVPFADIMFAMDTDFYAWLVDGDLGTGPKAAFQEFKGIKIWLDNHNYNFKHKDIFFVHRSRIPEMARSWEKGIFTGNNSGVGALMLAVALGCNPIYLLGYDASHSGGRSHFHSGYKDRPQRPAVARAFAKHFEKVAKQIKFNGFKVINMNSRSNIRCFPFGKIEDVL